MADSKQGAYATKAADTDFRRKWDKEEYAEKARKKDDEERERMQENEERMKQGTGRVSCTVQYTQANHLGSLFII
jgi:U4/U6.U5 tri-snRNP component SNU23